MKLEDYSKYYIQGSDHYLIPKDDFIELFDEMNDWKKTTKNIKQQLDYIRSGEYYNQLRFEREMLEYIVKKEFIKWLEDEYTKIQNDIEKEIDNNVKYFKIERRQIITEILQKYKETIGDAK